MQLELVFSWSLAGFTDIVVEYNVEKKSGKEKREKREENKK